MRDEEGVTRKAARLFENYDAPEMHGKRGEIPPLPSQL